jgi:hypothetical protein
MRGTRWTARLCALIALAAGVLASAQQPADEPPKAFGSGVTPSFEGWFDSADGSHNFLVGYLNRNRARDVDIPIGPNNRIEPGGPDMGQPTHFLAGRQTGLFVVTVPKDFGGQQKLTWTLVVNGETNAIPLRTVPDYVIDPFVEASVRNTPPVLHLFEEKAAGIQGPIAQLAKALSRTTRVAAPLALPVWADDDAHFTNNSSVPLSRPRPPVTLGWSKYRGAGNVAFDKARPALDTLKGGAVDQPYSGKATATATFDAPGEYVLHLTANDFSGVGGGGFLCCWTNALVKVTVAP